MTIDATNPLRGRTLADYAAAKQLPIELLKTLGLRDARYLSYPGSQEMVPAVRTPYRDLDGTEVAAQFRVELEKSADGGDERFRYQACMPSMLYGLWRLDEAREAGRVVVVEGPSDAQTLWHNGIPAIALRSAASWKEEWASHFEGIEHIIVVVEPDAGGEAVRRAFADSSLRDRVLILSMSPESKDVSALSLEDPESFAERWREIVATATPWVEEEDEPEASAEAPLLAHLQEWAKETRALPSLERELAREQKIKQLRGEVSSPARIVDAALTGSSLVESASASERPGTMLLRDAEPWPDEVDGEELLEELSSVYTRYLALPEGAADGLALWSLHTHCYDAFSVTPRLGICSPEKRCGKTHLLTVLLHLCPRPLPASNVTSAVVFRAIEQYRPTLLIDEADTFLRDKEELRGVLNSGHTKSLATVVRTVGDDHEAAVFSTWAPVAIAQIGRLPGTLEDRALIVRMRRRTQNEYVEALGEERLRELEPLRSRAARWATDHLERLRAARPEMPELGSDRATDNWRPLLAIADAAAGAWPERARAAARLLQGSEAAEEGAPVQLLADLRDLFEGEASERLTSERIVKALGEMEERPWPEWRHGQRITARQMAALLKPFGIRPKVLRIGTTTPRGYELGDFADAFSRYLPPPIRNSATCLQNSTFRSATQHPPVAHEKPPICRDVAVLHVETGEDEGKTSVVSDEATLAESEQQAWGLEL